MNKREAKAHIFDLLTGILRDTGFQLRRKEDEYVRDFPGGKQIIGLPFWNFAPEFQFSLNVCIRWEAAEELFHLVSGVSSEYHSLSFTILTRLEYFTQETRFRMVRPEDTASVAEPLSRVISQQILPFFDKYTEVKALNEAVNHHESGIDHTLEPAKSMHRIILAHLAKDPGFDEIVTNCMHQLDLGPDEDHELIQLMRVLRSRTLS